VRVARSLESNHEEQSGFVEVWTLVGRHAGTFAVPITVVPGCLGIEENLALA
jgi:hypothetical protein